MTLDKIIYKLSKLLDTLFTPFRRLRLNRNIKYIHGPVDINCANDEMIVVCLVRDGQTYIRSFIEHYLSMGVKHIVFMDNGSTDNTIAIAKEHKNVTILQCELPFKRYQYFLRLYLIRRFCSGRWSLCVDIDELFDFPYSDRIPLASFISYLNNNSYTAVVTQMLDMFSGQTIKTPLNENKKRISEIFKYYDINCIKKEDYVRHFGVSNTITNTNIFVHFGGIRKKIFNLDRIILTKHSLLFVDKKIKPIYRKLKWNIGRISMHGTADAKLADISCVLYHYKFHEGLFDQSKIAVHGKNYMNNSIEYQKYLEILEKNPNLILKDEQSRKLYSVNDLVDNGALVVSDQYRNWIEHASEQQKN